MRTPSLFCIGYILPHSIPSRLNQGPINVEYFQAQRQSRVNKPKAFTSDSIQALVTPYSGGVKVRVRVRVGWYMFT